MDSMNENNILEVTEHLLLY